MEKKQMYSLLQKLFGCFYLMTKRDLMEYIITPILSLAYIILKSIKMSI